VARLNARGAREWRRLDLAAKSHQAFRLSFYCHVLCSSAKLDLILFSVYEQE